MLLFAGDLIAPSENPSEAVYGMVVIGSLLAAESGLHESYPDAIGSAALAAILYWVAHGYSTMLGLRLAGNRQLTLRAFGQALRRDFALVRGALIPLLALALAWSSGLAQDDGVTAALWSTIASLVVLELVAGLRLHAGARELAFQVTVGLGLGLGILALKVILH